MSWRSIILAVSAAAVIAGCGARGPSTPSATPTAAAGTSTADSGAPGAARSGSSTSASVTTSGRARRPGTGLAPVTVAVPAGDRAAPFDVSRRLSVPAGWRPSVYARVAGARLATWTPDGRLLVSSPEQGGVFELTPSGRGRGTPHAIITGLTNPQGLAFDRVGGREFLYVAAADALVRYVWSGGRARSRTVLVPDLPDSGAHPLKNVVVGSDHTIYVDIGSESNADPPTIENGTPRATVIAYRPDGRRKRIWATGVRNGDGLSFAPDGSLWTAVNQRDNVPYPFHRAYGSVGAAFGEIIQSYVNDHPPDEVARLTPGRDLGWPYCNPDPDVRPGVAGTRFDYGDMALTPDAVTDPGSSRVRCARLKPIERGLPAHSAPLGLHFLNGSRLPARWANGAVVAAHGSWNREPPRPPVVYWMSWQATGETLGPAIVLVSGFQDADGNRWGRTADALPGPDGALYVTDDTAGAVYRIVARR